jgi:hypothetical protein
MQWVSRNSDALDSAGSAVLANTASVTSPLGVVAQRDAVEPVRLEISGPDGRRRHDRAGS